ncbi:MAG: TrkA family potassium uptake protein [Anaerolineae bacterium]|nr:TrkA family potassium uptake protein [Thermoflexales bacterium]MDW8407571.1 TrkA family potassium uptake protein [Anaerolineae bacterium]
MKVIVMGCGRVGEQVARIFSAEGHDVSVIDYSAQALDRLGADFKGRKVLGVGFDRNTLIEAGIEEADAFAATSSSDNVNIVAARVARMVFHVPRVVARLFDPRRAEIYQRLGLVTISSTTWGARRIYELLTHADLDCVMSFGAGEVKLIQIEASAALAGRLVKHITAPGEIIVVAITRKGQAFLPSLGSEFRQGDTVHLAVLGSALDRLPSILGEGV